MFIKQLENQFFKKKANLLGQPMEMLWWWNINKKLIFYLIVRL